MKHIAQKITREAAKDPVNPANPRPNKTKARPKGANLIVQEFPFF